MIVVTHDREIARHARRVIVLRDGNILRDTTGLSTLPPPTAHVTKRRTVRLLSGPSSWPGSPPPGRPDINITLPRDVNSQFRAKTVRRGDVALVVNSTGTVQPVLSVQVGAFVSGPIQKVCVDFNDKVKRTSSAQIDPRTYVAAVAHERRPWPMRRPT